MISRSNQTYLTDSQQSYLLLISYIIDLATAGICDYSELKCTTDNLVRNFGVSWDSHKMHRKCSIHFISWLYSICGRFSGKTERASYRGFHYLHTDSNFNSVKQVHSLCVIFGSNVHHYMSIPQWLSSWNLLLSMNNPKHTSVCTASKLYNDIHVAWKSSR